MVNFTIIGKKIECFRNSLYVSTDVKKEQKRQKIYRGSDFIVKRNTKTNKISVYHIEVAYNKETIAFIKAVNIEKENDIIWYKIINIPVERGIRGKYLYNYDMEENEMYDFEDALFKLFGNTWNLDTKLSKKDVLEIKEGFQEKIGEAKFDSLYKIKYKEQYAGERAYEGSRYFITYSKGKKHFLKSFDSGHPMYLDYGILYDDENNPFQIEKIAKLGKRKFFDKCRYTPEAIKQIIKDHEQGNQTRI